MLYEFIGVNAFKEPPSLGKRTSKKRFFATLTAEQQYQLGVKCNLIFFTSTKVRQELSKACARRLVIDIASNDLQLDLDDYLGYQILNCRSNKVSVCC
jgi:hypothetical protein